MNDIYNREYFERIEAEARPYARHAIAQSLLRLAYCGFPVFEMCELGTAHPHYIEAADDMGLMSVQGYDKHYSHEGVDRIDFETDSEIQVVADLILCLEVAEHLTDNGVANLLKIVEESCINVLIFSAASPGQGGSGHINERPRHEWIELIERGTEMCYMHGLTRQVKEAFKEAGAHKYLFENLCVFAYV